MYQTFPLNEQIEHNEEHPNFRDFGDSSLRMHSKATFTCGYRATQLTNSDPNPTSSNPDEYSARNSLEKFTQTDSS